MAVLRSIVTAYDFLVRALAALAGIMIAAASVLIVVDVSIRTAGVPPPAYTIAVVEYGLLYITMFTAPMLVRTRGHVYVDAIVAHLPPVLEVVVAKSTCLVAIVTSLVIVYFSFELLVESYQAGYFDERGVDVPQWLLYVPMPIGFALVAVEFTRLLFARELMHRDHAEKEGSV